MQSEALTLGVTQRVLQLRSDLPTRPVWSDVDQVPYTLIGGISLSDFPRGFFPGWLLSASSPSIPETISMTLPQVSPPPHFVTSPIAYQNVLHASPVIMSVGSPALAAYSLILTALNARSAHRRVNRIKCKNKTDVARALISLQQMSLELTKDPVFLASIPTDNRWEQEIISRLNRRNAWSLAAASSAAWVITAFLFTLTDSFLALKIPSNSFDGLPASKSSGHGIGTLWLWLLCLVIGWTRVPTFTCGELMSALRHANQKAAKRVAKRIRLVRQRTSQARNPTNTKVTDEPLELNVLRGSGELTAEVVEEEEKVKERSVHEVGRHAEQETDQKAGSLPNTIMGSSRPVSEGQRNRGHLDDSESQNSISRAQSARETDDWIQPAVGELLISKDSSSLNRDESRCAVTFNYARAIRYLALVEDVSRMFDKHFQDNDAVGVL